MRGFLKVPQRPLTLTASGAPGGEGKEDAALCFALSHHRARRRLAFGAPSDPCEKVSCGAPKANNTRPRFPRQGLCQDADWMASPRDVGFRAPLEAGQVWGGWREPVMAPETQPTPGLWITWLYKNERRLLFPRLGDDARSGEGVGSWQAFAKAHHINVCGL